MMLDTFKVSDDLTDSARQYRANILDVVSAMECALAGKPHPRILNLTPEQRFWRMLALKAADRPPTRERWEMECKNWRERGVRAHETDYKYLRHESRR